MKTRTMLAGFSLLLLASACGGPAGEPEVPLAQPADSTHADIGDHMVHFSAQLTDQLPPEIARAYNIVRSKNRAMLTVSVLTEEGKKPVPADVSVRTVNLTGQLKNVTMRRVDEQEAIYYIGETGVANRETLIFDISVKPEGVAEATNLRFKREFYTDN